MARRKNRCSQCGKGFNNLENLKAHMTREHGGFTASEIVDAVNTSENPDAPPSGDPISENAPFELTPDAPEPKQAEPRRSSRRNRELNDRLNAAMDTIIEKALGMPVSEQRLSELKTIRSEVRNAIFGVEFDFDEKIVKVGSRWVLVVLLLALYVFPYMPPIPFQKLIADMKAGKKKINEPNKNNGSDRPEGFGKDVSDSAAVREN